MQIPHTLKVVSISRGMTRQASRESAALRDGWGTPTAQLHLVSQPKEQRWSDNDEPLDVA